MGIITVLKRCILNELKCFVAIENQNLTEMAEDQNK